MSKGRATKSRSFSSLNVRPDDADRQDRADETGNQVADPSPRAIPK